MGCVWLAKYLLLSLLLGMNVIRCCLFSLVQHISTHSFTSIIHLVFIEHILCITRISDRHLGYISKQRA